MGHHHHRRHARRAKLRDEEAGAPADLEAAAMATPTLPAVPYYRLFRFADTGDKVLMALGSLGAVGAGAAQPLMTIVMGNMINVFNTYDFILEASRAHPGRISQAQLDAAKDKFFDDLMVYVYYFLGLAVGTFVLSYAQMALWKWAGESQTFKVKKAYLQALLRQEIAYYDTTKRGELTSRINSDTDQIQEGISDKVGSTLNSLAMFVTAFVIAFTKGPVLAGILCTSLPLMLMSGGLMGKISQKYVRGALNFYARAGAVAEEVFAGIKTVASFGRQKEDRARYRAELDRVAQEESSKGFVIGGGIGSIMFIMFASYSLAFWYGAQQIGKGNMDVGTFLNTVMAYFIGSSSISFIVPNFNAFVTAGGAAARIYDVIDRTPVVDPFDESGLKPDGVKGDIQFKDVKFAYPTRLQVPILNGFSLNIDAGTTVALVGQSGSGKSTCISLLERYYQPLSGSILLDGTPLNQLNIQWLRSQIGVISQEPVLFNATIRQNVAWGADHDVTDEEIETSLRQANAWNFVKDLPEGTATMIGESGANLSGGQKQRIAIARALIRDPKILLLDEATSALDTQSEKMVQDALDNASRGRTTIIVAHRLSSIRDADKIVVMKHGEIVELGTHQELIDRHGFYWELVHEQQIEVEDSSSSDEDEEGYTTTAGESSDSVLITPASLARSASVKSVTLDRHHAALPKLEDEVAQEKSPIMRVLRMNISQWRWILLGCFSAFVAGGITPGYALVYSEAVTQYGSAMILTPQGKMVPNADKLDDLGSKWGLVFLGIAIGAGLFNGLQMASFITAGEAAVLKIRDLVFYALIGQEGAFYDRPENSVGALASKLAVESNLIRKLVGDTMGTIVQITVTLLAGSIIALVTGWQLALVVLACAPLILFAGVVQSRAIRGLGRQQAENAASQLASEAVGNVRTIAALSLEKRFLAEYDARLDSPYREARRNALIGSIAFALSTAALFLIYCVAYVYAGYLLGWNTMTFRQIFRVIMTVMFSAMMGGRIASLLPDYATARDAAYDLFRIIDRRPPIDVFRAPESAVVLDPNTVKGEVEFRNVHFRYPTRPKVKVHRGLSFTVPAGKKVALVGASGCGKSTCIQQLMRWYDCEKGEVLIDGVAIPDINVNSLRAVVSTVAQEPILMTGTIADNIKYGALDPTAATEEDVIRAAKAADVHEFIKSLPLGYATPVGEKGSMLSGGQKQRVAIARALIRNPKILLLDESTSALDAESEALVQRALDAAAVGRTTIVVAHRLSTVQNADLIVVLQNGRAVEQGTHRQLIAAKGVYFGLVQTQMEIKPAAA
ncbi:hypothetical protein AMAG_17115 [Allomyces macrogynus ATCC 38327]|uniref:Uncharacterized protein n=1 Tax=Allomyces macrogynus (strain ATCC 38327) TaxID=578462 RepID=A0A0L0TDI5_ALLM3|nr:hypothetical protein AMAG_17115 [Allomyces macrogynus ATCC 38327]|eukprot:KNE72787.1 hypothetical protein AMAG_17115 [Allomyces macrogynus ATCC 38327]